MSTDGQGTKRRRNIAENFNLLISVHERYRDDRRQRDGRMNLITSVVFEVKPGYIPWKNWSESVLNMCRIVYYANGLYTRGYLSTRDSSGCNVWSGKIIRRASRPLVISGVVVWVGVDVVRLMQML